MKRWKAILLLCVVCFIASCGGVNNSAAQNLTKNTMIPIPDEEPEFVVSPLLEQKTFSADDGTVLAEYSYQLVTMSLGNPEELSADAEERAEQVVGSFNERMESRLSDAMSVGQELGDMAESAYESEMLPVAYSDEATASVVRQGQIYSIRVDSSSFTGGAHPNSYTDSYLFDVVLGQFIDPAQVADDPVAFQTGAAKLLLEKAKELDTDVQSGYYPEYEDVIAHWYDGTVLFDKEGMTVVYSPYVLGPYALGTVELKVSYQEIEDLLGPGGQERLGIGSTEEAE